MAASQYSPPPIFEGATATNRQTGERIIFRGGQWQPLTQQPYAPEVKTAIDHTQSNYQSAAGLVPKALEFQRVNQKTGTGGLAPAFAWANADLQNMDGLTAQMVRSQIQPGTSGAANSDKEQQLLKSTFPGINNFAEVNDQRVRDIKINRDVQLERLQALQDWARRGGRNISEFEAMWAPREQSRRADLQDYYTNSARWPKPGKPQLQPAAAAQGPAERVKIDLFGNVVK